MGFSSFLRSGDPDHHEISAGSACYVLTPRSWVRTLFGVLSVKYASELYSLTVVSTATALMWVPYVLARMTTHGVLQAIGNPGPGYPADLPWVDRARRAHPTQSKTWLFFAPLVLVAAFVQVSTRATILSAQIYVAACIAHHVIYAAGAPVVRTIAFLVGACSTLVIAAALLYNAV
jgi:uncharacterized MAPEG superfamily protein